MNHNASGLVEAAKKFAAQHIEPIAKSLDEENRCPVELIPLMVSEGFFRAPYPVSLGGLGLSQNETWAMVKELSKASAGIGLMYVVHWMATDVLIKYGSQPLKDKYLADLITGQKVASYAISETTAGSDAASMACLAEAGESDYKLKGSKFFVTNGSFAKIFVVAAKTAPDAGAKGISLFLVERDFPGLETTCLADKMGFRSSATTNLRLHDCPVPKENLIGDENKGFKQALDGLIGGRLGMAALGIAIGEAAMADALSFANRRKAFGKPISQLYSIQEKASQMYIDLEASKLLLRETCELRDEGKDYSLMASAAKVHSAKTSQSICYEAIQMMGGHGYMRSSRLERLYRDSRLIDIGVGTSEVLHMVIGSQVLLQYNMTK